VDSHATRAYRKSPRRLERMKKEGNRRAHTQFQFIPHKCPRKSSETRRTATRRTVAELRGYLGQVLLDFSSTCADTGNRIEMMSVSSTSHDLPESQTNTSGYPTHCIIPTAFKWGCLAYRARLSEYPRFTQASRVKWSFPCQLRSTCCLCVVIFIVPADPSPVFKSLERRSPVTLRWTTIMVLFLWFPDLPISQEPAPSL